MPILLTRPYPVHLLAAGANAIRLAAGGDVAPLQALYRLAVDALREMDPDEVAELRRGFERADRSDAVAARAALEVAETWEGVIAVGSAISDPARFRGFAWLAAQARYCEAPASPALLQGYASGGDLPDTSPEDAALFAALPALIGLGPELPEEVEGPCPLPGEPVHRLLGLPDGDWAGIDPLDAVAVAPDVCLRHLAGLSPAWRAMVERCAGRGLIVRPG